jgi:hypothetical protein
VARVADENPAVRRGAALALGVLPRALLTQAAQPALLLRIGIRRLEMVGPASRPGGHHRAHRGLPLGVLPAGMLRFVG